MPCMSCVHVVTGYSPVMPRVWSPWAHYAFTVLTMHSTCVHCAFTMWSLCAHHMFTAHSPCVHLVLGLQWVHCASTMCSLGVYNVFTMCSHITLCPQPGVIYVLPQKPTIHSLLNNYYSLPPTVICFPAIIHSLTIITHSSTVIIHSWILSIHSHSWTIIFHS